MRALNKIFIIAAALIISSAAYAAQKPWPSAYGALGGPGYTPGNLLQTDSNGTINDAGASLHAQPGVTTGTAAAAGMIGELVTVTCPNSSTATATFTNGSATIGM